MKTKKQLLEERTEALSRRKALHAEIGESTPTPEQDAEFTKLSAEIAALNADLEALNTAAEQSAQRLAAMEADEVRSFGAPAVIGTSHKGGPRKLGNRMSLDECESHSRQVLSAWAKPKHTSADIIEECRSWGFNPLDSTMAFALTPSSGEGPITLSGVKKFAQGISSIGAGGALIQPSMLQSLEVALLAYGGIRQYAQTLRTTESTEIPYPTLDTTSATASIVGENAAVSATSVVFGNIKLRAYKYSPGYYPVSNELMRDSALDIGAIIGAAAGQAIGRGQAAHFISGTGAGQPRGIVTAGSSGVTTAAPTAFTVAEIRTLIKSLDPAYRALGASFLMHDNTAVDISELKGGDGQYLWKRDLSGNNPPTFDGYPVNIDNSMPSSLAALGKPIAFGVLNKYIIRDVSTIRIKRLDELHALNDQTSFVAFMESDGNLLDAGTDPFKYMTLHS